MRGFSGFIGFLRLLVVLGLLAGCASRPTGTAPDNSEIEEAESDMEDSKREYEGCLADRDDEVDIDCEVFRQIYEEDREAYEHLIRLKKAGTPR